MKHTFTYLFAFLLLGFLGCQSAADVEETPAPDYALFNKNVEILKSLLKAHCDEDLAAIDNLLADTMRWSPPTYVANEWLGKKEFLETIQGYHNDFEDITYYEGIVQPDTTMNGWWSGSIFPQDLAYSVPNNVRIYGVWTSTHSESGAEIALKWFALGNVNVDGKIVSWNEFFDVNGIAAQIAAAAEEGE